MLLNVQTCRLCSDSTARVREYDSGVLADRIETMRESADPADSPADAHDGETVLARESCSSRSVGGLFDGWSGQIQ